jgi:ferredoxin
VRLTVAAAGALLAASVKVPEKPPIAGMGSATLAVRGSVVETDCGACVGVCVGGGVTTGGILDPLQPTLMTTAATSAKAMHGSHGFRVRLLLGCSRCVMNMVCPSSKNARRLSLSRLSIKS